MSNKNSKSKRLTITVTVCALLLLISMLCTFIGNNENEKADSAVISSKVTLSGDLLLSDYKTRNDGMVFNGDVLKELYNRLTNMGNATYDNMLSAAKTSKAGTSSGKIHSGLDSNDIRTRNSGKNLVVKLGGKDWAVTCLTTNDSSTPDPILTLWVTECDFKSAFSTWSEDNTNYTYLSNMYSTSYVRARLLNGVSSNGASVGYIDSAGSTTFKTYTKDSDYPFGIYTVNPVSSTNRNNGSITDFLEKPKNIPYQKTESQKTLNVDNWNNCLNESTEIRPSSEWVNSTVYGLQNRSHYFDWADDYLWLPSWSETGWGTPSGQTFTAQGGLWNSDEELRGGNLGFWHRTGIDTNVDLVTYLYPDGTGYWCDATGPDGGMRPALHLNLRKAMEASVTTLTTPTDVTSTYDGNQQDYFNARGTSSWYSTTIFAAADVSVAYSATSDSTLTTPKPINAGTYNVTLTINDSKYIWASGSKTKVISFKIDKASLSVDFNTSVKPPTATPTNICDEDNDVKDSILRIKYSSAGLADSYTYPTKVGSYTATVELNTTVAKSANYILASTYSQTINVTAHGVKVPTFLNSDEDYDGNDHAYQVEYDADKVEITRASKYTDSDFVFDGEYVILTNAGEYEDALVVKLKDAYNPSSGSGTNIWDGTSGDTSDKYLSFNLNKKKLTVNVTQNVIEAQKGDTPSINLLTSDRPISGDLPLTANIMAKRGTATARKIGEMTYTLSSGNAQSVTLDLTVLIATGDYTLSFETADSNYDIEFGSAVTLKLSAKTDTPQIIWWLNKNGSMTNDSANMDIGGTDKNLDYSGSIVYGKDSTYSFTATASVNTYTVDTSYGNGFVNGYKTTATRVGNDKIGINADTYVTEVAIKNTSDGTTTVYSISWTISKAKYDLSGVTWKGSGKAEYTGSTVEMTLENLPDGLTAAYTNNSGTTVGNMGTASVMFNALTGDWAINYVLPTEGDSSTYIGNFSWSIAWEITKAVISAGSASDWENYDYTNDATGNTFKVPKLKDTKSNGVVEYEYYETDSSGNVLDTSSPIELEEIEYSATQRKYYKVLPELLDENNYSFGSVSGDSLYSPMFTVGGGAVEVSVELESDKIEYNGKPRDVKLRVGSGATANDFDLTYYTGDVADDANKLSGAPTDKGNYLVVVSVKEGKNVVLSGKSEFTFEIIAATVAKSWNKNTKPYVLNLKYGQIDGIEYEIRDKSTGNTVAYSDLSAGNSYEIRAKIKEEQRGNYSFKDGTYETEWEEFELRAEDIANMTDPNDPSNPNYPQDESQDPTEPSDPGSGEPSGEVPTDPSNPGGLDMGKVGEFFKSYWRELVSGICLILTISFLAKTASYESKRKRTNKKADKYDNTVYAATTGLFGLATGAWTAIMCVMIGLAVGSFVIMLIAKGRYNKAEDYLEEARDRSEHNRENSRRDYDDSRRDDEYRRMSDELRQQNEQMRQREENMQAMFMKMFGGNFDGMNMGQGMPQGAYMGAQQGIGVDDIRGIISETVTALLPGMQQAIPQQASANDELVQKLIEQNQELMQKNDKLMQQLIEKPKEKVVEKQVVAASANDDTVKELIEHNKKNDERLEQMMRNQEALIAKLMEKNDSSAAQPQVIERIVEKPVEKIVEKVVEKPVEKIVEKEVRVEVPVEKVVEKVVEKPVAVNVTSTVAEKSQQVKPTPKKEAAPRLTLEEAYAKLTKEQKKYFDGLREYAMKKDSKCKEKLATYFTTIGPSTTNPLIKLTIKKGVTVALFKMEDEYLKDIRRNAGSDGTKIKVKETEMPIGDAQAFDTAKDMVDLRIDQIERYEDFLKEQRAMKRK